MTFDEMVFICQILWIRDQLANQVKPKNYPNFTPSVIPVSNSNASSTNNYLVREFVTPFITITTFTQPPVSVPIDQSDPMDLSISKGPKKLLTPEKRKYRFDNNLCLYCGKPGHRAMDHKTTTQQVNFVTPIFTVTSSTTIPFAIEIPSATQQQKKKLRPIVCKNHHVFSCSGEISNNKRFVSR